MSLRLYPHALADPTAVLDELQGQAQLAIANGYEGVMLSERHGGAWGQIPNPLQVAGWLLAALDRGWAAPCPLLLTLRTPAVAAEEIAWLAARFPGRVAAGFGAGGNEADFRFVGVAFGDRAERFDRALREVVDLLRGATPANDPAIARVARVGLPLLCAATGPRSAERAARLGLGMIGSSLLDDDRTADLHRVYRGCGGSGPCVVIARLWIGVPPLELIERQLAEYRDAGEKRFTSEFIHGADASDVAARLAAKLSSVGADAVNIRVHTAGLAPEQAREQIEIIGREVLPELKRRWP